MLGASSQSQKAPQQSASSVNTLNPRPSFEREASAGGLQPPSASANASRSLGASGVSFGPRGSSLNPSIAPGSFSSELRSQMMPSRSGSRGDIYSIDKVDEEDSATAAEQTLAALREQLNREMKIKDGSENMLEALNAKKAKQTKEQRAKVEAELNASNQRIKILRQKIADASRFKPTPTTPTRQRTNDALYSSANNGLRSPPSVSRSGAGSDNEEAAEQSPTFLLAELLRALEQEGMPPEYYVSRGNSLVDLFRRHPTLKYDLVWSVFGLRMQVMLLSEAREVVAAGYRMIRYAISDVGSLKKIRSLNTDIIVVTSLIKDRKADLEREQALKFVRAFLDVKDGVKELSRAVVRTVAAVAEQAEDRLRSICLETLAEIMLRDPALAVASGGLAPLSEALIEGTYKSPESLTTSYMHVLDSPQKRVYLRSGYDLEVLFTAFTDIVLANETLLKQNAKAITKILKSWPGLMILTMHESRALKSLLTSMVLPQPTIRETVIDLVYLLLRIKSPSWASSFLAGRRLTTYGRVASLKSIPNQTSSATPSPMEEDSGEQNFMDHYTALLLATFVKAGLLENLLQVARTSEPQLSRKTCLLIGEVLKLSSRLLPSSWSNDLPLLPELFAAATQFKDDNRFIASGIVYQISSVSRTLYRSSPSVATAGTLPSNDSMGNLADMHRKSNAGTVVQEGAIRQLLVESNVLNSSNYLKWNWDVISRIIEGPLQDGKRLDEVNRVSKFMNRIMSFYRPFKHRFSDLSSNKNTQKYVRVGCALMHTLLQSHEGVDYLQDHKMLRQIAECLAQCDPSSGLTSTDPMFSPGRLQSTLCAGYFPMLGVLSGDPRGLELLQRWRMFNMMYHILGHKQRPDLIKLLLSNFDYSIPGHPRVLIEQALTSGTREIRITATNALRKYATRPFDASQSSHGKVDWKWAIEKLCDQLYDPEVEVCRTAVKILEKACNKKAYLEYVVQCRPTMDHLGEIGAPLLLRFLSSSIGYHYLDGVDYISNEMDDWFLGRNDSYVGVIETSLAKAFLENPEEHQNRMNMVDEAQAEAEPENHIPPHFYRELARTQEGCKLLSDKGHFAEFASTIKEYGMQSEDAELLLKVKASMWAVGNVGSMELGAPFIESCDVVEDIVKIAEEHEVMSLRGTAFFVLGLISRSAHGLEILSECGWDANLSPRGESLGFCIPNNLSRFFSFKPWDHAIASKITLPDSQKTFLTPPPATVARPPLEKEELPAFTNEPATNQRILDLVVDLGNMVLYKRAMGELMQIRQHKVPGFRCPKMFKRVMTMLEYNHYRLPIRRMVLEMFDKSVLRRIVFGEDSDTLSMVQGRVLVIAGSDSSGGAGLEADQKVIAAHGCYAMTATTALTAQDTTGVHDIHHVPQEFLVKQIDACVGDIGVDVVKTGMLASPTTIGTVVEALKRHKIPRVVVDPVMIATSGAELLPREAVAELLEGLLRLTTVLTPNIPEAKLILEDSGYKSIEVKSVKDLDEMARSVQALGPEWVLVKGGHAPFKADFTVAETEEKKAVVVDVLYGQGEFLHIQSPYQSSTNTHGTGCALASAIASNLAKGLSVPEAVRSACRYIEAAIKTAPGFGKGHGPLNHFHSVQTLPFAPGRFIEYMLARPDVKDVWKAFVYHPFVMAMGDGTLPTDSFKRYLIQDYLYLVHFARANALASYKAKNIADIAAGATIVSHITREMSLHIDYCKDFGITVPEIEATEEHQACTAYTRYVLDVGMSEDWIALQMALAPCLLGYGAVAKQLHGDAKTKRDDNTYWKWIENYVADDYVGAVKTGSGAWCFDGGLTKRRVTDQRPELIERHAVLQSPSSIERLVKIFIHGTKVWRPFHNPRAFNDRDADGNWLLGDVSFPMRNTLPGYCLMGCNR
ncbi:Target of rapamycin complex 2 subunit ste20, partial [Colletotrichum shisoi]